MAYLDQLVQEQNRQIQQQQINAANFFGLGPGEAYAQYFPTWEVTAPQYPQPNAYTLAQLGYRTNEVAYACINLWMKTIAEPEIKVYDREKDMEVDNLDDFYRFMEQPCPDVTQTDFWSATEMYLKIAGAMSWEKDTNNNGKLRSIWPMMPQYCSYLRGEGQLLRAIRYQPYTGLPFLDVDRDRVVMFMYADPLYYGLKPLSPTAVLADIIGVDNNMTKMVSQFLRNGAFVSGLLATDQVINEADARFAKERFRQDHGGPENAGDVVVLGKGMKFERMGQTFREMVFPEVDARSETRICQGYSVKPILVSAKVGTDRATYNNYEQARQSWYDEEVTSEWAFLSKRVTRDILPHFSTNPNHYCKFDTRNIKALQEDRNKVWERARGAYKDRIIVRNTALVEMGLDPLGDSDPLGGEYYQTVMRQSSTTNDLDIADNSVEGQDVTDQKQLPAPDQEEEKAEEEKNFRAFAKRRTKENKPNDIGEFEFKHVDTRRQRQLLSEFNVPDPDGRLILEALLETVKAIKEQRRPQDISIKAVLPDLPAPIVNIENNMPEQKSLEFPTPQVTVNVEPTPVQVNTPRVRKTTTYEKVKRDGGNNIEGKAGETTFEYDE